MLSRYNALREHKVPDTKVDLVIKRMTQSKLRTKETPKVSHFTWFRGNSGKSTSRMERTVMSIIWAFYVVSAEGSGIDC